MMSLSFDTPLCEEVVADIQRLCSQMRSSKSEARNTKLETNPKIES